MAMFAHQSHSVTNIHKLLQHFSKSNPNSLLIFGVLQVFDANDRDRFEFGR